MMRGSLAKSIRAITRRRGQPNVLYVEGAPPEYRTNHQLYPGTEGVTPLEYIKVSRGVPTRLHSKCDRARYRAMKRNVKQVKQTGV